MRVHPLSLALQYLKGRRTWHGRKVFADMNEAVDTLRQSTGQDFGTDAKAWGAWLRTNRAAYHWDKPRSLK
jgi:hypothetical protein